LILERRHDPTPHVLIATKAMGKNHRYLASPNHLHVISFENIHRVKKLMPFAPSLLGGGHLFFKSHSTNNWLPDS
jgi:hypothetical protein